MYPLHKLTNAIIEAGVSPSAEELAWRFLQPLFPDSAFKEYSWTNWSEMKQRMFSDVSSVTMNLQNDTSLYHQILRACIQREREKSVRAEIDNTISKIFNEFIPNLEKINQMGKDEAATYIETTLLGGSRQNSEFTKEDKLNMADWTWNTGSFLKEIVPPLDHSSRNPLFRKIPLIPAIYNLEGDSDKDWWYLSHASNSLAGTVREWLNYKQGYGLVLYRYEGWQMDTLKKL